MLERLQSILVVSLITLLIWLYAEGQKLAVLTRSDVRVEIVASENSDLIVRPAAPDRRFSIRIEGPTGALDELEEQLAQAIRVPIGRYEAPSEPRPEPYTISMLETFRRHPIFAGRGVSIRSVDPDTLTYSVDRWVAQDLEVQVAPLGSVQLDGPPVVEPSRATVQVAESVLRQLDPNTLHLVATPESSDSIARLPEGEASTVDARLSLPAVADRSLVKISNPAAQLTLTVKSQRVELTKNAVPIHLIMTPLDVAQYTVELERPVIDSLELSGPSDVMAKIERGEIRVIGLLRLTSDDLVRGVTEKTVSFDHLPSGVTVISDPYTATFQIRRRDTENE
ncbi:MAG: hypothetical protein ACF8PN_02575 [Phycisphaerales bacterium]